MAVYYSVLGEILQEVAHVPICKPGNAYQHRFNKLTMTYRKIEKSRKAIYTWHLVSKKRV